MVSAVPAGCRDGVKVRTRPIMGRVREAPSCRGLFVLPDAPEPPVTARRLNRLHLDRHPPAIRAFCWDLIVGLMREAGRCWPPRRRVPRSRSIDDDSRTTLVFWNWPRIALANLMESIMDFACVRNPAPLPRSAPHCVRLDARTARISVHTALGLRSARHAGCAAGSPAGAESTGARPIPAGRSR